MTAKPDSVTILPSSNKGFHAESRHLLTLVLAQQSGADQSEDVITGKTHVKNWPFHVLELRKAIEQVVDAINAFDVAWVNKLPDPAWIPITTGRPQAAVMQQLQTLILVL